MFQFISGSFLFVIVIAVFFLMSAIKILNEFERGVIFRLGRALPQAKGPGLILLIPMIDRLTKVNLQLVTYDVPSQDIITRDNVTMKVNAVVYFRVIDPLKAIIEVRDYWNATQLLAQTTLRSVCGQVDLDELLLGPGESQRPTGGDPGQTYRSLGHQGDPGGTAGHRPAHRDAAGHGQAGRSGAGTAGQGDQRRG